MTFTRTKSGLANYALFFGSEIIIYAEGRCETGTPIEDETRGDTKFYLSLAKAFLGYEKIKVKLVGNRTNALDYHDKILKNSIKESFVFVDRDYQGLTFNPRPKIQQKLLTTYGYSWENDFWTISLCRKTISIATASDKNAEEIFNKKIKRTIYRLKKLCALNAAGHIDGRSVFPSKGNSKGINLDLSDAFPLKKIEFSRISRKIPLPSMCETMKSVLRAALNEPPQNLIQGHLLEHICLTLLNDQFKTSTGSTLKNNEVLKNIALSSFMSSPKDYLSPEAINHYNNEFSRI